MRDHTALVVFTAKLREAVGRSFPFFSDFVFLKATQIDNPARYAFGVIQVFVEDVNDHRPLMTQTLYEGTVLENAAEGTVVLKVREASSASIDTIS